jgi:hypothetical protein
MTVWEDLVADESMQDVAPAIKVGLQWAYKYYQRMDATSAYVVTMCKYRFSAVTTSLLTPTQVIHPGLRLSWFRTHWDADYQRQAQQVIMDTVRTQSSLELTKQHAECLFF